MAQEPTTTGEEPKTGSPEAAATASASSPHSVPSPHSPGNPPSTGSPRSPGIPEDEGTTVQAPVQVDDERNDDPGFGDGASVASESFASSLNSSILQYKYQNGRRYHAFREGSYLVPNDDEEQDRMDLGHHIYRLILGGELHLAPIRKDPQRVLDMGTGTGIWAIDFADQYPSAQDPAQLLFEVDDFEQEWTYKKKFDYVHCREVTGCLSNSENTFREVYDALVPGGYFEIQCVHAQFLSDDGTDKLATNAHYWMSEGCAGAAKFGKPLDAVPRWRDELKAVGFTEVQQEIRKLPIGGWPKDPNLKELGKYQLIQEQQVIDSYTPGIFGRVLGWDDEQVQVLIAKVKKDLTDPAHHLYLPVYFIWGKKP